MCIEIVIFTTPNPLLTFITQDYYIKERMNTMSTIRIYVLLCTLLFIICPSAQAADVSSTKAWTITFSQPVDEQSLSPASIQLKTPSGQLHPARLTQLDDITVQISPLTPYKESGTYSISIANVRSIHDQLITPHTTSFTFTPVPKATWIWNAYSLNEADAQFLISEGVTKVYVQVESELPYEAYVLFFHILQQHNIEIYALEGFAGLQFQDDQKTERFLHWVTQFQQQYGYFTGIHIDVEPYTDPSWQQNEQQLLEQYFFYIQQLQQTSDALALRFEIDIPFWFDEIIYTNDFGTGVASHWLIDHSDEVTIMAYRNNSTAILPLVADEFSYATHKQKPLTIAIETAPSFEGDFISFYNTSTLTLYEAIDVLYATYHTPIAIHYLPTWQALVNTH